MTEKTEIENPYATDEIAPVDSGEKGPKKDQAPAAWRTVMVGIFTLIFGSLNALLNFIKNLEHGPAFATGSALGAAIFFPLMIAGLFAISKRYRKLHKFLKAIMWIELVFAFLTLVNISQEINKAAGQ